MSRLKHFRLLLIAVCSSSPLHAQYDIPIVAPSDIIKSCNGSSHCGQPYQRQFGSSISYDGYNLLIGAYQAHIFEMDGTKIVSTNENYGEVQRFGTSAIDGVRYTSFLPNNGSATQPSNYTLDRTYGAAQSTDGPLRATSTHQGDNRLVEITMTVNQDPHGKRWIVGAPQSRYIYGKSYRFSDDVEIEGVFDNGELVGGQLAISDPDMPTGITNQSGAIFLYDYDVGSDEWVFASQIHPTFVIYNFGTDMQLDGDTLFVYNRIEGTDTTEWTRIYRSTGPENPDRAGVYRRWVAEKTLPGRIVDANDGTAIAEDGTIYSRNKDVFSDGYDNWEQTSQLDMTPLQKNDCVAQRSKMSQLQVRPAVIAAVRCRVGEPNSTNQTVIFVQNAANQWLPVIELDTSSRQVTHGSNLELQQNVAFLSDHDSLDGQVMVYDLPIVDRDHDGVLDLEDNCPEVENLEQTDLDGDSIGDECDPDVDGDGHMNDDDVFPSDSTEWWDTDLDGLGDNMDPDADNDGIANAFDAFPLDATEARDSDSDGVGDVADDDDDNDGVIDAVDVFPLDPQESIDTDGDWIGNRADTDDDGDGVPDLYDAFPLDAAEHLDTDLDGIGNNADLDDDGDGVADTVDYAPHDAEVVTEPAPEPEPEHLPDPDHVLVPEPELQPAVEAEYVEQVTEKVITESPMLIEETTSTSDSQNPQVEHEIIDTSTEYTLEPTSPQEPVEPIENTVTVTSPATGQILVPEPIVQTASPDNTVTETSSDAELTATDTMESGTVEKQGAGAGSAGVMLMSSLSLLCFTRRRWGCASTAHRSNTI